MNLSIGNKRRSSQKRIYAPRWERIALSSSFLKKLVHRTELPLTDESTVSSCEDDDDNKWTKINGKAKRSRWLSFVIFFLVGTPILFKGLQSTSRRTKSLLKSVVNDIWDFGKNRGYVKRAPAQILDYLDEYPEFRILEDNYEVIRKEAETLLSDHSHRFVPTDRVQRNTKSSVRDYWKTITLNIGEYIPENTALAPRTTELLQQIPGVSLALFSVIEPHKKVDPHWGIYGGYLRYHMGLIIPNNNRDNSTFIQIHATAKRGKDDKALVYMEGIPYYWKNGEGVMFDDTYLHYAENQSDETRVVLILDVLRKNLPWYFELFNRICVAIALSDPMFRRARKRAVAQQP